MRSRGTLAGSALAVVITLAGTGFGHVAPERSAAIMTAAEPAAPVAVEQPASPPVAGSAAAPVAQAALAAQARVLPTPKDAPANASFSEMTHVWQSLNNCGPAAVVMALSTLGIDESQEVARLALRGTDVRRGMGPQGVGPWVKERFGLRSMWRNNGTNDLMRRLVANGFAPMVTQWMQDPTISRIAHWRTVRGYDDAKGVFYVNDSMLGNMVALSYDWFGRNWQSFSYRYMVVYRVEDEPLLQAIVGRDWNELLARQALYERARTEAQAHDTNFAWLALGEAAYANGVFDEAVAAFERGMGSGSAQGVFGLRNSYPQALRALGRQQEADIMTQKISGLTPVPATVAAAPDNYAMFLAIRRSTPYEALPTE